MASMYRILLSTCVSSGGLVEIGLRHDQFTHVFLDEVLGYLPPVNFTLLYFCQLVKHFVSFSPLLQLYPFLVGKSQNIAKDIISNTYCKTLSISTSTFIASITLGYSYAKPVFVTSSCS